MAKSKREEVEDAKGDGYEFQLPEFDEKAFIRREVLSARASFVALGVGALGGVLAAVIWFVVRDMATPFPSWLLGMIPLLGAVFGLRSILTRAGFPEDVTSMKAVFGSMFMVFFTGLSVWILGINLPL